MMKIFVATKQLEALEELMGTFRNKFKHIPRIWGDMAKMYYRLRNFEKARQLRNDALENITNVKQSKHFTCIQCKMFPVFIFLFLCDR